jgi:hypothetical protein
MLPIVAKRYPIGGLNVNDTFVGAAVPEVPYHH